MQETTITQQPPPYNDRGIDIPPVVMQPQNPPSYEEATAESSFITQQGPGETAALCPSSNEYVVIQQPGMQVVNPENQKKATPAVTPSAPMLTTTPANVVIQQPGMQVVNPENRKKARPPLTRSAPVSTTTTTNVAPDSQYWWICCYTDGGDNMCCFDLIDLATCGLCKNCSNCDEFLRNTCCCGLCCGDSDFSFVNCCCDCDDCCDCGDLCEGDCCGDCCGDDCCGDCGDCCDCGDCGDCGDF